MTLTEYFDREAGRQGGDTIGDLARRVGSSPSSVYRWVAGDVQPALPHALAVERETRGAVRVSDLVRVGE